MSSGKKYQFPDGRVLFVGERLRTNGDPVYMTMFRKPNQSPLSKHRFRGKNLAVPLQRNLHITLKSEGYKKLYGYFWNDNIPAMWMHRMLKFKELPRRRVSRIFIIKWAKWID